MTICTFCLLGGGYNTTTNVTRITRYFSQYGFTPNNTKQTIRGFTLYPQDYFCPKNYATQKIDITPNTHTIHHFAGSWLSPFRRFKVRIKQLIGANMTARIISIKKFIKGKLRH